MKIKYATIVVNNMEESVKFYTDTLGFTIDGVYDIPGGKITLLDDDDFVKLGLIRSDAFGEGVYSIGLDVEDIVKEMDNLTEKGANIALEPVETPVGYMARIIDPNGVNIVLVQHTR